MKKFLERFLIVLTVLVLLLALLLMPPFTKKLVAMSVMGIYSSSCEKEALTSTEGIIVDIPGGGETGERDWFPFVITFHPGELFGGFAHRDASLTILYNFGDFVPSKGCSTLFDPESPFYSSFYGAYLVKTKNGEPYGFTAEDGVLTGLDHDQVAEVARFDYQRLVLRDFGLTSERSVFDFTAGEEKGGLSYAGSEGWFRVDAELTVNGCAHKKSEFAASYLQYGIPAFDTENDLAPVKMFGRIYGRFIEEKNVSLFFYIIAADREVLENCDREILSKSTLTIK